MDADGQQCGDVVMSSILSDDVGWLFYPKGIRCPRGFFYVPGHTRKCNQMSCYSKCELRGEEESNQNNVLAKSNIVCETERPKKQAGEFWSQTKSCSIPGNRSLRQWQNLHTNLKNEEEKSITTRKLCTGAWKLISIHIRFARASGERSRWNCQD